MKPAMSEISVAERRLLVEILRKMKADRSPYVPVRYFKHIPDYARLLKELRRKDLAFFYKEGAAVGLTEDGVMLAYKYIETY